REQIGTLDAVLRTVSVDVQRRDTQVTVVDQCRLDQLLQGRVMEKLTPALFRRRNVRRFGRRIRRTLRVLRRDRRCRLLVLRDQRAAAENERGNRQRDQGLAHWPASSCEVSFCLPLNNEDTETKNNGTQKIARTTAVIIPPITPVPIEC